MGTLSQNKEEKKNRAAEQAQQANAAEAEASAAEKAADSPGPAEDAKAEDAAAQDPIQKELEQTKDLLLRTALCHTRRNHLQGTKASGN